MLFRDEYGVKITKISGGHWLQSQMKIPAGLSTRHPGRSCPTMLSH